MEVNKIDVLIHNYNEESFISLATCYFEEPEEEEIVESLQNSLILEGRDEVDSEEIGAEIRRESKNSYRLVSKEYREKYANKFNRGWGQKNASTKLNSKLKRQDVSVEVFEKKMLKLYSRNALLVLFEQYIDVPSKVERLVAKYK